jgi:hypothetical protein
MKSGIAGAVTMRLPSVSSYLRAVASGAVLLTFMAFPRAHFAKQNSTSSELTVHEWGTFTSISARDGRPIDWLPLTGSTDLPSFVEHLREPNFKGGLRGTIRMETPVIYFYALRCARINLVLPAGEIPAPTRGAAASPGIESWVGGGNESGQA